MRWQTCDYLPSRRASPPFGRHQFILIGDRGTYVWITYLRLLRDSGTTGGWTPLTITLQGHTWQGQISTPKSPKPRNPVWWNLTLRTTTENYTYMQNLTSIRRRGGLGKYTVYHSQVSFSFFFGLFVMRKCRLVDRFWRYARHTTRFMFPSKDVLFVFFGWYRSHLRGLISNTTQSGLNRRFQAKFAKY